MKKLIDLPKETVAKLQSLADKENRTFKNYVETVLINYADTNGN